MEREEKNTNGLAINKPRERKTRQTREKTMSKGESEKYLKNLCKEIGGAIDEIETGGLMCSANTHLALVADWNTMAHYL